MTFAQVKKMRLIVVLAALCISTVGVGQAPAPLVAGAPTLTLTQSTWPATSDNDKPLDGRLFFSAQQRQRLDDARKRGVVGGDDGKILELPPSVLNGFVKRSDGNTAVWVDGISRWNAKSGSMDVLSPSDVGGPAAYLKTTQGEVGTVTPTRHARIKKAVLPRVKKMAKRRRTR